MARVKGGVSGGGGDSWRVLLGRLLRPSGVGEGSGGGVEVFGDVFGSRRL